MRKNTIYNITGCIVALIAGAWTQNAKAEYTDANGMKLHWKVSKDLFPKVFDDSFRHSDFYGLWSATFSPNFKHDKGDLYCIKKATDSVSYHTFHTADDLEGLPIDASLKKICEALGSRRFLAEILDEATVDTIRDRSMEANRETTVTFKPCYDGETFFDAYGNARLDMYVTQVGGGPLHCSFRLTFKKEGENVSLTGYEVDYGVGTFGVGFCFLPKPQALSQNLFPTLRQAGLKMNDIYRGLFDKKTLQEGEV